MVEHGVLPAHHTAVSLSVFVAHIAVEHPGIWHWCHGLGCAAVVAVSRRLAGARADLKHPVLSEWNRADLKHPVLSEWIVLLFGRGQGRLKHSALWEWTVLLSKWFRALGKK